MATSNQGLAGFKTGASAAGQAAAVCTTSLDVWVGGGRQKQSKAVQPTQTTQSTQSQSTSTMKSSSTSKASQGSNSRHQTGKDGFLEAMEMTAGPEDGWCRMHTGLKAPWQRKG